MKNKDNGMERLCKSVVIVLCVLLVFPFQLISAETLPDKNTRLPEEDTQLPTERIVKDRTEVIIDDSFNDSIKVPNDTLKLSGTDIILTDSLPGEKQQWGRELKFNPNPNRAVWLSALFPGLGQVYNRRYWKLPIVAGGFLGISYALSWNGRMLSDYTKAYRDAMDNDPATKSYLAFFPSTMKESDIDMNWLKKTLKSRKDFYRRNRDLSIICMVGMYLLCMVDAYVDASLSHFDITPDLSMNVYPSLIDANRNGLPSVGIQWAINF